MFRAFEQHQKDAAQQERKHLRTNSPGRGGSQRAPKRHDGGEVGASRRAQENQKESGRNDSGKGHDESAKSRQPIDAKHQDFGKPLMVYPGLAETSKRIRIGMEDAVVVDDQLSGAQVPPDVGVGHATNRHGEQAESENEYAEPAGLQEAGHAVDKSEPIVAPCAAF